MGLGLKTSAILVRLRNSDLAGLHVLGFGQTQCYEALINLRADFIGVERWIELEHAPEIFRARFAMNQRSFRRGKRPPSDDRQLIVFDRNLEAVLLDTRHVNFKHVAITNFSHAGRRRNKLLRQAAIRFKSFSG